MKVFEAIMNFRGRPSLCVEVRAEDHTAARVAAIKAARANGFSVNPRSIVLREIAQSAR